jgi:23S rRNA (adenine2503-C2)-methyltransferase
MAKPIYAKVNLICFNKIEGEPFEPPTRETVKAFQKHLTEANLTATIRYSAGGDISAACGQLRLQNSN